MLPGADRTREVYDKWTQWCYNNEHIACAHSFDPKLAKKYKVQENQACLLLPYLIALHQGWHNTITIFRNYRFIKMMLCLLSTFPLRLRVIPSSGPDPICSYTLSHRRRKYQSLKLPSRRMSTSRKCLKSLLCNFRNTDLVSQNNVNHISQKRRFQVQWSHFILTVTVYCRDF